MMSNKEKKDDLLLQLQTKGVTNCHSLQIKHLYDYCIFSIIIYKL